MYFRRIHEYSNGVNLRTTYYNIYKKHFLLFFTSFKNNALNNVLNMFELCIHCQYKNEKYAFVVMVKK